MRMSDPVSAKEDSVATRGPAETEPSSSSSSPGVDPLRRDNGVSDTTSSSSPSSSSPCPEQTNSGKGDVCCHNKEIQDRLNLQISRSFDKEELSARDDDEKEKSCEKQEKPSRQPLSRDSSQDYTDSTGIDLHEFLVNTLKNNPRDRIMLLKLEQEILDFISNNEILKRKFPPMTSYHRMLLHRVAAYFGMEHNVDPTGKSVVINKTSSTRIPDEKFSEHIKDGRTDEFQRRYILKRDNSSFDREDCMIRMRLKDDRRSKSIEEREEEYQRARDRIFAQDGDHFYLDRRIHDEDGHMSTQQRRQIFRLRDSQSGTSRQSSSDNEPRYGEPRPWSSTDSSDSSHRNPLPAPPAAAAAAITKASSFSSISLLVRGDSTPSSKSTGPLSKTGSESSGSVGSSTSSLSRPQLPLLPAPPPPAPAPPAPPLAQALPVAAAPTPGSSATVPGSCGRFERSRTGPALAPSGTSYYLVPLETAGIPAGSVLVNPHTGQPFVNPDGSPVVYNPTSTSSSGCPQQHPPPPPSAPQHTTNHMLSQQENLSGQFSHMTLVRQASGDAPVQNNHAAMFPSSTMVLQCPQQHAGYMVGPPGQPPPGPGYPSSGPGPGPPAMSQQMLQQQTYIQQQPVQQMASCYCGPAQYQPQSSQQHYRPVTPLHYTTSPQGQQPGYSAMLSNPVAPQSYQSVLNLQQAALPLPQHPHAPPPPPNPNLLGNPQHGAMGNQMQSMMVQYPSMASYQVSVPQMSHSLAPQHQPQPQPQQGYQQPFVFSTPPSQPGLPMGGMQVYYSILPQNQHSMSSTVCFLPPPGSEHMQFPRAASPCGPQPLSGQQQHCSGVHPTPTPPPPGGGGMVMMQLTLPSNQQQPRPHSPIQWKQHKYYSVEHHHYQQPQQQQQQQYQQQHSQHLSHRALEHETHRQSSGASLASSTAPTTSALPPQALSPSPGHLGSTKGPCSSSSSMVPILAHHQHHPQFPPPPSYSHGQGEGRYSLLGQPLQFNPTLRPPLIHATHMVPHHQSSMGIRHSGRGRKPPRKSLSTDLSVGEPVSGRVLEVTNLPEGISRGQADTLLAQLSKAGANIKWLSERQSPRLLCGAGDGPRGETNAPQDLASTYTILALFPSEHAAQSALLRLSGPLASFKLRTSRRQDELGGPGKAGLQ